MLLLLFLSFPCLSFVINEEVMKQAKEEKKIVGGTQGALSFYSINSQDPNNKLYVVVKKISNKWDLVSVKKELCSGQTIFKEQDFGNTYAVLDMDGEIWFVMEPILGTDLRTIFQHIPEGLLDEAFRYYIAAATVKNYRLQQLGIDTNDSHAGNVMVDAFTGQVKLIDFGISKKLSSSEKSQAYRRIGLYQIEVLTPEGNPRWNKLSASTDRDNALQYLRTSDFEIKKFRDLAWFEGFSFESINPSYFPLSALKQADWRFYNDIKDRIVTPNMVDKVYRSSTFADIDCSSW